MHFSHAVQNERMIMRLQIPTEIFRSDPRNMRRGGSKGEMYDLEPVILLRHREYIFCQSWEYLEMCRMMQQNAVIAPYPATGHRIQHREENMDGDTHYWNPTSSSNWNRWVGITPRDKLMAEKWCKVR